MAITITPSDPPLGLTLRNFTCESPPRCTTETVPATLEMPQHPGPYSNALRTVMLHVAHTLWCGKQATSALVVKQDNLEACPQVLLKGAC